MDSSYPTVKDLVLVGGGHTHAIILKMFAMKPLPGVRLTLITEASQTPYSGMLPGHVAGLYTYDECHIELRSLAEFAQAQLLLDQVTGLDLKSNRVFCSDRPPIAFDLLSINIGSIPATLSVPGALEHAIPVKPVSRFLAIWHQVVEQLAQTPQPLCLGIVGGGAGGVELALAMQHHLHRILRAEQPTTNLEIHLFHQDAELMPTYSRWVRGRFHKLLTHRGIKLHLQETVSEIQADPRGKPVSDKTPLHRVKCESGFTVDCDSVFWVTQASAPGWLQEAGLATDLNGFIQVQDTLQSVSHPQVFAAGDIAAVLNHPRPKAGVFAVRQGKPLFQNLCRALLGQNLKSFTPQKQFLSLISTGNPSAIAARGPFAWESPLLWHWKDQIDRKFMARFQDLPAMSPETSTLPRGLVQPDQATAATMRCSGCGAKVGSTTLERVLQRIHLEQPGTDREDILISLDTPDDAAVVRVPAGQVMLHSVDYFRAIVNDPFVFGQISANHCLSDIFAMGAVPQSALAIAVVPYALEAKLEETLYQLLSGAIKVLHQAETPLVGGHTTEGAELGFGLSCNGLAYPNQLLRKGGLQPGQVLILTKALGTGTLFAANMRLKAKGRWIDGAIQSMLLSNQAAAACFLEHGATACTDITGFGLLGHLMEMIQAHVSVELDLAAMPILEGAQDTLRMGFVSSLQPQNLRASQNIDNLSKMENHPNFPILFDPQTSGGLLAAVPQGQTESCLGSLKSLGYRHSSVIGYVTPLVEGIKPIKIIR